MTLCFCLFPRVKLKLILSKSDIRSPLMVSTFLGKLCKLQLKGPEETFSYILVCSCCASSRNQFFSNGSISSDWPHFLSFS